jgi:GH24 family phage-related lysozyme (muramidase)
MKEKTSLIHLVELATKLDSLGKYEKADKVDQLLKEASIFERLRRFLLGAGAAISLSQPTLLGVPERQGLAPIQQEELSEEERRQIILDEANVNNGTAKIVEFKEGMKTLHDIIKKHKYLKSLPPDVVIKKIILPSNEPGIETKLKPGTKIKLPTQEYLEEKDFDAPLGVGLVPGGNFKIVQDIIDSLLEEEGFMPVCKETSPGNNDWTIGYGHKTTEKDKGKSITKNEAKTLFNKDLQQAIQKVKNANFPRDPDGINGITDVQFTTLVFFVYNVGHIPQDIREMILSNPPRLNEVAEKIKEYNKGSGLDLTKRREKEANLWNSGL